MYALPRANSGAKRPWSPPVSGDSWPQGTRQRRNLYSRHWQKKGRWKWLFKRRSGPAVLACLLIASAYPGPLTASERHAGNWRGIFGSIVRLNGMGQQKVAYRLSDLLGRLIARRGDAIHFHEGEPPVLEIKSVLCRVEGPCLENGDTYALLAITASEDDLIEFQNTGLSCFYHRFQESSVFKFMAFREDERVRLEIRKFK